MIDKSLSKKKAQYKTWQTDDYILYRYKNYLKGEWKELTYKIRKKTITPTKQKYANSRNVGS